jgi:DNA-binding GntR family transcriptional regulator
MQEVEDRLRASILNLDLKPGERLSERSIETRLAASRTPVRAALFRLEGEGLVTRDGRNWSVAPIDLDEIEQVYAYRLANEVAAARITCAGAGRADCTGLAEMLASCDATSPRERWHEVGLDFHIELARLSGNLFLTRAVRDAMRRLSRARWLEIRDESGLARAWREHIDILAAIENGDAEAAAEILARHIETSRDRLVDALREDRRGLRARGLSIVVA